MFIVLEGLDGAGKSTQLKALEDYFTSSGKEVKFTHFPHFDSPVYGELVAKFLRGELGTIESVNPYLVALLYAGDRSNIAPQMRSWLAEGYIIIADRYIYSNIAYQCAKISDPLQREELRQWIFKTEYQYFGIPKPDLNIFLDVPITFVEKNLAWQRSGESRDYLNGKQDIHEQDISFQRRVRDIYLQQQSSDSSFKVINCCTPDGCMSSASSISNRIRELLISYNTEI